VTYQITEVLLQIQTDDENNYTLYWDKGDIIRRYYGQICSRILREQTCRINTVPTQDKITPVSSLPERLFRILLAISNTFTTKWRTQDHIGQLMMTPKPTGRLNQRYRRDSEAENTIHCEYDDCCYHIMHLRHV
jgi:hypothetical protein